jgi:hypothetical protein
MSSSSSGAESSADEVRISQGSFSSEGSNRERLERGQENCSHSIGEESFHSDESYDEDDHHIGAVSSEGSMSHHNLSPESRHDEAIRREEDRVLQQRLFHDTPDFVGNTADQSRLICEKLIQELDIDDYLEDKIRFWITYRKLVKNQLIKY